MAAPEPSDHTLAQRILGQALDDLRREAVRVGRSDLFEQLLPDLLGQRSADDPDAVHVASKQELRLALNRLRERLRERVNAQLRALEPDQNRRRALRQRLQAAWAPREATP